MQNKERARKLLAIALDLHQAKEIRIQAVRVLKAMDAVDELWTVANNVKCPFTKQSAIDSIPALEVKLQTEQISEQMSVPENTETKEVKVHVHKVSDKTPPATTVNEMRDEGITNLTADKIQEELVRFGLTPDEARIYAYLAKYADKRAAEISKSIQLPMAETYHLLSSLQNKGLVTATFQHPIKFNAVSFDKASKVLST